MTVVVALAFGLSATLFDKFVEKIEQSLVNTEEPRRPVQADEMPPPTSQVQQKGAHANKARRKRRPDAGAKKTGARVATQTQPNP